MKLFVINSSKNNGRGFSPRLRVFSALVAAKDQVEAFDLIEASRYSRHSGWNPETANTKEIKGIVERKRKGIIYIHNFDWDMPPGARHL